MSMVNAVWRGMAREQAFEQPSVRTIAGAQIDADRKAY
jgi:hypothetical protein